MINETVNNVIARVNDELNAQAEALLTEIQQATSEIDQVTSDVETRWTELEARSEDALSRMDQAMTQLDEHDNALNGAANTLRGHIENAVQQGNSFFEEARGIVETLDQGIGDLIPDIDGVATMVQDTINTLGDEMQGLDGALEAVRSITDEHLHNPFNSLIENIKSEVYSRAEELGNYATSELLPAVQSEVETLSSHVDQIVADGNAKAEECRANAESEGSSALDTLNSMFGDTFGGLIETGQTIANLMQQIGGALTNTTEIVGTTTKAMSSGVNLTAIGAKSVINIIEGIVEIFNSVV